jgi:hypothetical protein
MAHAILPQHRPHEQLRTEAPKQKSHSDKYVSAFVSSENNVDLTFMNPLLQESADHFKVGIDEFTVNLSNLSMLEYSANDVLFRIRRLGTDGEARPADDAFMPTAALRTACEFKIDRAFLTIHEIVDRFKAIANALGSYVKENGLVQPGGGDIWRLDITANDAAQFTPDQIFDVKVTANGSIQFVGDRFFWANFVLEVPTERYRYLLLGSADTQYVSVHPATGATHVPYVDGNAAAFDAWGTVVTGDWGDEAVARTFTGSINILHTLDRRVTLEVGCSLPIRNSPMVDHGVESPDFVLGRYMFHKPYGMVTAQASGGVHLTTEGVGVNTLQGPRDRVVFHHLGPQQKIQTLRLRLWARVRTYDVIQKKWGMKTIVCPVQDSDYWHIRLHFVSK